MEGNVSSEITMILLDPWWLFTSNALARWAVGGLYEDAGSRSTAAVVKRCSYVSHGSKGQHGIALTGKSGIGWQLSLAIRT